MDPLIIDPNRLRTTAAEVERITEPLTGAQVGAGLAAALPGSVVADVDLDTTARRLAAWCADLRGWASTVRTTTTALELADGAAAAALPPR